MAAPREPVDRVATPCVRKCCLDAVDICLGCGRSLQEILDWHQADDGERRAILARAEARLIERRREWPRG